ncbi:MAG TPA: D-alanine--D-alanine ligase [Tepidisphaeraceae bacterium]|nr:D-alanine--D-alanine ligase [Tepidisphaeraceae bacterium]
MKVTVLFGGPSAEREVSLVSGQSVIDGLRSMGHEVFGSDVSPTNLSGLDQPADVIFPVLHGQFGESGELQEILEQRGLPFVGSSAAASRLGMDKVATKRAWEVAGLPTPAYKVITSTDAAPSLINQPCVVKAISSGSSIDVFVCKEPATCAAEATQAIESVLARHDRALIERFIDGIELTVGLLEEQPLAPIRIVPKGKFFDFKAKYNAADTEHRFDLGIPPGIAENVRELAKTANAVVGGRDLARIDVMLDERHSPFLLEINTLPGFTPKSLLPEAAKHAGIEFGPLVDRLVRRAYARHRAAA